MIEAMNASGVPIVAVDLPSGVNGTTGAIMGAAVNASVTVTFFRRKTGHLLLPGRLQCGIVEVADIGIPESVLDNDQDRRPLPMLLRFGAGRFPVLTRRGTNIHAATRWSFRAGHRPQAPRALLRGVRCGRARALVTIASPREALAINAAESLAVMVRPVDGPAELGEFLGDRRRNAVVLGPGGGVGPAMREEVLAALSSHAAVVLDADALTSFADHPDALAEAIRKRGGNVVLTPHRG